VHYPYGNFRFLQEIYQVNKGKCVTTFF
jgi:hypothetical protein